MGQNRKSAAASGLGRATASLGGGLGSFWSAKPEESVSGISKSGQVVEFGKVLPVALDKIARNPRNDYESMSDEELRLLAESIGRYGMLNALILRSAVDSDTVAHGVEFIIICGENRFKAAALSDQQSVPARIVVSPSHVSAELEDEIMEAENDRRRGGTSSYKTKRAWVQRRFGSVIRKKNHGGSQGSGNLAAQVEKESRGKIPKGTAQRIIADIRAVNKGTVHQKLKESRVDAVELPDHLLSWKGWEELREPEKRRVLRALQDLQDVGLPRKLRYLE